jgi:hypothetical protein
MFPLLSLLPMVGGLANKVLDAVLPDNMSEEDKHNATMKAQAMLYEQMMGPLSKELEDLADARSNERMSLSKAGPVANGLRAGVTIFGGYGALSVVFWNIVAPYFDYKRVTLNMEEYAILGGIIAFYFGKRLTEKVKGVSSNK